LYLTILLFLVALVLIMKGGEYFVSASVAIAEHLRVPRIVIGSTIVSLATTSPEFTVSAFASLTHNPGVALGNAVGSVIVNIALILGLACVLTPIPVKPEEFRFPSRFLLVAAVALTVLTFRLVLSRLSGLFLVGLGLFFLLLNYLRQRRYLSQEAGPRGPAVVSDPRMRTLWRSSLFFLVGLAMVVGSSKLMVDSAVKMAEAIGVPQVVIGLTLVAFGTSVPELVTAMASIHKRVADLSLGNIAGASLMCCTFVAGGSAAMHPLTMTRLTQRYNLPAMLVTVVALLVLARAGERLSRRDGAILLCLYIAYVAGLLLLRGE